MTKSRFEKVSHKICNLYLEKNPSLISFKKKLERGKIISIDLHGYTLDEANHTVEKLIIKSFENNISKLIIVTGKGLHSDNHKDPYVSRDLSILKHSIPSFIKQNQDLMSKINEIKNASIEDLSLIHI